MAILVQHEYPRIRCKIQINVPNWPSHGVKCSHNGLILRWYDTPTNTTSKPWNNVKFHMIIVLEPINVFVELEYYCIGITALSVTLKAKLVYLLAKLV